MTKTIRKLCLMLRSKYFPSYKVWLLIISLALFAGKVQAGTDKTAYSIKVKIANCTDTLLYLNHYFERDIINDDTARRNPDGSFIFKGKNKLDEGLYYVSSNSRKRYFDFFVTGNQEMWFDYDGSGQSKGITTSDSVENKNYFQVLACLQSEVDVKSQALTDSVQYLLNHADLTKPFIKQIIDKPGYQLALNEKYIKACISPSTYQHYYQRQKRADKVTQARTYLDHYFDNFDFSDARLINTPVFTQRLDEFIDTISAIPDVAMKAEVDRLIALSAAGKRTQEFVAWHLISRFETYYFLPENEELYEHIVRDFLETGKIAWYYPVVRERELIQASKFEPILTGKPASELEMPDTAGTFRNLYSVNARYTLLLFWASTCSHCRDEMPTLLKFYTNFHKEYDLEIFAVSTDTSAVRWKSYVHRHQLPWINVFGRKGRESYFRLYDVQSTPTMFLLDDKKTILAKYLTPEKFGEIIRKREMGNGK